jgi:hypothetical protein
MDDGELEDKIDKIAELVEEDHKLIKGMHSRMRLASAFRIIYWIIIALAAFGAYVSIQPYVDNFKNTYNSVNQFRTGITGDTGFFKKFFVGGTTTPR